MFDRAPDRRIALAAAVLVAGSVFVLAFRCDRLALIPLADRVGDTVSALLAVHAIVIAVTQRDDDLVEARRFRPGLLCVVVAGLSILVLASEAWVRLRHRARPVRCSTAQDFLPIAVAVLIIGAAMLEADPALLARAARARRADGRRRLEPPKRVLSGKPDAADGRPHLA